MTGKRSPSGMVQTAASLSAGRWIALARATVWVVGVRAALATLPWRRVSEWFATPGARPGTPDWDRARIDLWAVHAVTRRLLKGRPCLTQALVARRFLRRHGVKTDLRLGAVRDERGFQAHAWLERDGRVVIGGTESIYTPFRPLRPASPQERWEG